MVEGKIQYEPSHDGKVKPLIRIKSDSSECRKLLDIAIMGSFKLSSDHSL